MISAMKKRISNNKGLTLIELIIVIAIIGILAVIGVTRFGGMTNSAKVAADQATLSEIQQAARLYVGEGNAIAEGAALSTLYDGTPTTGLNKYIDLKGSGTNGALAAADTLKSDTVKTVQLSTITFDTDGSIKGPDDVKTLMSK